MHTHARNRNQPAANDSIAYPVEQFITYRLLALTNRLNRQAMQILDETAALRLPEWRCLAIVHQRCETQDEVSLHDIADTIGMDPALISRSVQGLVEKGHLQTERDATDRRVVHARLTPQGAALCEQVLPIMRQRQLHLLNALSSQDQKALYRIIDRLNQAVEAWEQGVGVDVTR